MFFPKLEHLTNYNGISKYMVKEFDQWLASQPEIYHDYLNPFSFIRDTNMNKKLSLKLFTLSSKKDYFKLYDEEPLLSLKYVVRCPSCDEHFMTCSKKEDIPNEMLECHNIECDEFNPLWAPHRIEIFYELKDSPIILEDELLDDHSVIESPPLLSDDEDLSKIFFELEEQGYHE